MVIEDRKRPEDELDDEEGSTALDPEAGHDDWFRAKVEEALAEKRAGARYVPLGEIIDALAPQLKRS